MTYEIDFKDDESITDDDVLWRRVTPLQLVSDGSGGRRASSAAFRESSDGTGMSVDLALETTIEATLNGYKDCFIAGLKAQSVRELGQGVMRMPVPTNLAHASVFDKSGKRKGRVDRKLNDSCFWIVNPNS